MSNIGERIAQPTHENNEAFSDSQIDCEPDFRQDARPKGMGMFQEESFAGVSDVSGRQTRSGTPPLTPRLSPMRSASEKQFLMGTSGNSISDCQDCRPLLRSGGFVEDFADSQSRPTTNPRFWRVIGGALISSTVRTSHIPSRLSRSTVSICGSVLRLSDSTVHRNRWGLRLSRSTVLRNETVARLSRSTVLRNGSVVRLSRSTVR